MSPHDSATQARGVYGGLQALRFVAAALVLIGHTFMVLHNKGYIDSNLYNKIDVFPWGVGVDIFFILSGFLIARATSRSRGAEAAINFVIHRLIRICPLYWLYTLLFLLIVAVAPRLARDIPLEYAWVIQSLAFIPARPPGEMLIRPPLAQGWTLNYEMAYYGLMAFAIATSVNRPKFWVSVAVLILFLLGFTLGPATIFGEFFGYSVIVEFVVGLGSYAVVDYIRRLPSSVATVCVLLGFVSLYAGASMELPFGRALSQGIPAALVFVGFLAWPERLWREKGPLAPFSHLGDASYSLYLSHPFVIHGVVAVLSHLTKSSPVLALSACGAAIVVSLLSFNLIEKPSSRMLRNWWARSKAVASLN